jgi:hypothetical protein
VTPTPVTVNQRVGTNITHVSIVMCHFAWLSSQHFASKPHYGLASIQALQPLLRFAGYAALPCSISITMKQEFRG